MIENFDVAYDFIERPDNDGQPLHITEGDPGGATVYGWTYRVWLAVAPLYGVLPTYDAFKTQTKESLKPLTRAQFWSTIQADHLPTGIDLFWFDFRFGSGGATVELQKVLGVTPDGVVGLVETVPAVLACNDRRALLDRFLVARTMYYDRNGFRKRWPGLYRRAVACHALAISMIEGKVDAAEAPMPSSASKQMTL